MLPKLVILTDRIDGGLNMQKKILHLASFNGNVGDILNHEGFYRALEEHHCSTNDIYQLEIRDFYRGLRKFDETFVDYVNQFDLCIIGGGNYFELWVDHSPTGTSIMLDPYLVSKIKTPLLFNALGVDLGQGTSEQNIKNFKTFLDEVFRNENNILSVRNDGAYTNLVSVLGEEYSKPFLHTPDAGFYSSFPKEVAKKKIALINLPGDMLETRFPGGDYHSLDSFISEFSNVVTDLLDLEYVDEVTFIPHIYKDYSTILQILQKLPDKIAREHCRVAELNLGHDISMYKEYYSSASVVLGSRFHSNVSALITCNKVIGLQNYPQIKNLYDELELGEKLLNIQQKGFFDQYKKALTAGSYEHAPEDFTCKISDNYNTYIKQILHIFY